MPPRPRLTRVAVFQLAAESSRDPKTVEAVVAGDGNALSRSAVLAAARRLGYPDNDPLVVALSADPPPTRARA
jgi:hypothetical protein